jgi:hypothetical protein
MQLGSFVGSVGMFLLVNVAHVFEPMANSTNHTNLTGTSSFIRTNDAAVAATAATAAWFGP